MSSWRDKVTGKVSRLFYESPSSSLPPSPPPPPQPDSPARPHSTGSKSLSSIFSYILPSTRSDGFRTNKGQLDIKPVQSLPVRWNSKSLVWRDDHFDCRSEYNPIYEDHVTANACEEDKNQFSRRTTECDPDCVNEETPIAREEYETHASGRSADGSDGLEEANQHVSENPLHNLTSNSSFISLDLYEFLQSCLPNIVKGCQWVLLYSTLKHGISLRTLIRKSADLSGPCLLIVGDKQGAVFGGLLECPLKATAKRKYQGTNQTFVFTTVYGEPRLFRPTGANRYFYLCLNDLLVLGGGGYYALSLDEDLLNGTSGPCETFGNLCLAHNPEFELKNVELWGFAHASQYNT